MFMYIYDLSDSVLSFPHVRRQEAATLYKQFCEFQLWVWWCRRESGVCFVVYVVILIMKDFIVVLSKRAYDHLHCSDEDSGRRQSKNMVDTVSSNSEGELIQRPSSHKSYNGEWWWIFCC